MMFKFSRLFGFSLRIVLMCALVVCSSSSAQAKEYQGRVVVHDGDTFTLNKIKIRLWGIDAPELAQQCQDNQRQAFACGIAARDKLRSLVNDVPVTCAAVDIDRYKRTVARCTAGGVDLNAAMVASGWAVDYGRYSHGAFHHEEAEAKQAVLGVWAGSFVNPWEWRKSRR